MAERNGVEPDLIPARRIPSDDCEIVVDGQVYHPHKGQAVWIRGKLTIGEMRTFWALDRLGVELDVLSSDPVEGETPEEAARRVDLEMANKLIAMDENYAKLLDYIAGRVVDWDWTDIQTGELLPKPDGTQLPIERLNMDEIYHLKRVLRGQVASDPGNGTTTTSGSGSLTSSSDTTSPVGQSKRANGGVPSHSRTSSP